MMKNKDFAVFILSHGRADKVYTYNSLIKSGYTGKIFILIDNEDQSAVDYYSLYGNKVIIFDKKAEALKTDTIDNFEGRKAIVYARNANFRIAKDLGIKYFLQLDDDYTEFLYRINGQGNYPSDHYVIRKYLDNVFDLYLDYLKESGAKSIAMAQGGDFIGGENSNIIGCHKRKCMNTWFFNTENPVKFIGKMNEDYTTSIYNGSKGDLFMTIPFTSILQKETQINSGGMTEMYLDSGTYIKTFYSIIVMPSAVKVYLFIQGGNRLHHLTSWENAVPKIVSDELKKTG